MSETLTFKGDKQDFTFSYKDYHFTLHVGDDCYKTYQFPLYELKFSISYKDDIITLDKAKTKDQISFEKLPSQCFIKDSISFDEKTETMQTVCEKVCETAKTPSTSEFFYFYKKEKIIITHGQKIILIAKKSEFDFLGFKIKRIEHKYDSEDYYKFYMFFSPKYTIYLRLTVSFDSVTYLESRNYQYGLRTFTSKDFVDPDSKYEGKIMHDYYRDLLLNKQEVEIEEPGFTIKAKKIKDGDSKFYGEFTMLTSA